MKIPRRQFLRLVAGAGTLPATWRTATAQTYPARPIILVVPFPPGGSTDVTARILAAMLALVEGQPYDEIADALGISVGAVKLRVFRAVRILRQQLRRLGVRP